MTLRAPFLCQPLSQSRVATFGANRQGKEEHERAREDTPVWMAHGRYRPGDKGGDPGFYHGSELLIIITFG